MKPLAHACLHEYDFNLVSMPQVKKREVVTPRITKPHRTVFFPLKFDDAEKITNRSHSTRTLKVDLHNKIIEDLTESTDVVPAKYPPKVKLELFSQL